MAEEKPVYDVASGTTSNVYINGKPVIAQSFAIEFTDRADIDGRATCVHEDAVKWNPYNHVVQCHRCGQVFVPVEISAEKVAVPPTGGVPMTWDEHQKRGHLHFWSIQYTTSVGSRSVAHKQSLDEVASFIRLMLEGALSGVPTEQSAVTISSRWYAPEPLDESAI